MPRSAAAARACSPGSKPITRPKPAACVRTPIASPGSPEPHLREGHVARLLATLGEEVPGCGERHYRGAVLVVMHDRNAEPFDEALLDLDAIGSADILEVNAREPDGEPLDRLHEFLHGGHVEHDRHGVEIHELAIEEGLGLHDGKARQGADVAEAKDAGTVADDRDGIPRVGV
jgi:hypothetical protein